MRILFLDFEATDSDPKTARITQVAYSIFDADSKKELYHYSCLINITGEYKFNADAQTITGITSEQLEEFGVDLGLVLRGLLHRVASVDYVVAHNFYNYDLPLLESELARLGESGSIPKEKMIDSRFDIVWPSHIQTRKLLYLAAELGLVNSSAHSARHDVDILAALFFKFDLRETIARAASPQVWMRAMVNYDDREKAKEKKFTWDGKNKWWVKQFKEMDLEKEVFDFQVTRLQNYVGP